MQDINKRSIQLSETMIRLWLIQEEVRTHQKFYENALDNERFQILEPVYKAILPKNYEAN